MSTEALKQKQREYSRQYYLDNKEKRTRYFQEHREERHIAYRKRYLNGGKEKMVAKTREKLYNINTLDIQTMLKAQHYKCLICEGNITQSFSVDHCHNTKQVRGLLCKTCNIGLGHFHDNPLTLRKAIDYLVSGSLKSVPQLGSIQ